MFKDIAYTAYADDTKPVLVWDGECGFCQYWVIKLQKQTRDAITYKTYQNVSSKYKDIAEERFKEASRLIEPDGSIFSGPDSFYRSLRYCDYKGPNLHYLYTSTSWFKILSNWGYNFIAKHRGILFKVSIVLFGKNP